MCIKQPRHKTSPVLHKLYSTRYAVYDYDELNRLTQRKFTTEIPLYYNYTYKSYARNTETNGIYTTSNIDTEFIGNNSYTYTYGNRGNITGITKGTRSGSNANATTYTNATAYRSYTYDDLGQLTKEKIPESNLIQTWSYDDMGNITAKKEYNYTTGAVTKTVSYNYGASSNTGWNNLLLSVDLDGDGELSDTEKITYDKIGNPKKYLGTTMTWYGRQMTSYKKNDITYTMSYDSDGLRATKTVDDSTSKYVYANGQLHYEERGDGNTLYYFYDSNGYLSGIQLNGTNYYTATNLQGDVIAIYNYSGNLLATYEYDAWGNILSVKNASGTELTEEKNPGHIAILNPIRYRGYYYDSDLGLYYLQSRYYDANVGRFINADSVISGVGGVVLGNNVFAYCLNNPVNYIDATGYLPKWVTGALNVISGTAQMVAGAALGAFAGWTGAGAVVGGFLFVNGAATVTQGIGQIANDVTNSNTFREDNIIKTAVQDIGYAVGGDTGSVVAGAAYEAAVTAATIYAGSVPKVPSACFIAGTAILTELGSKVIEKIKEGDLVWSENPETGEKALKQVVQTFVNETNELVYVFVNGEKIVTTPNHPFYVPKKGWTSSIKLRAGDVLVLQNGEYVTVEKIQHEILEEPVTVYNFEVEDFHTYYVGYSAVLVHNLCTQRHHLLTNKNKTFTPRFQEITNKYNLNLNDSWNIRNVTNHMGRHTNSYHEFMYNSVSALDAQAKGNLDVFMKGFKELADYVVNNPSIMY